MIRYVDTSLLVSALIPETHTVLALAWLKSQETTTLATSEWTITEISAALSIKVRMGILLAPERDRILLEWAIFAEEEIEILPVESRHFRIAADLANHFESGLRAGDALHLAISSDAAMELWTLDRRLAEAGPKLGLRTHLLA